MYQRILQNAGIARPSMTSSDVLHPPATPGRGRPIGPLQGFLSDLVNVGVEVVLALEKGKDASKNANTTRGYSV